MKLHSRMPASLPGVMSLPDYWDALSHHDWYCAFSDDYSVTLAGERVYDQLKEIAGQSPSHAELLRAWTEHMFSGEAWKTRQAPKPPRPVS